MTTTNERPSLKELKVPAETRTSSRKPAAMPARPPKRLRTRLRENWMLTLFAIPAMVILLLFHYFPLLGNVIAFQDYLPFLGIDGSEWVGFDNFAILFNGDPAFLNAVKNTLVITFVQTVFVFPAPIVLALLLNSLVSNRLKGAVQSIMYLPHFLSWVIVVSVFQQLLGGSGFFNNWIRQHGGDALSIIGNPDGFIALITSQVMWKDTGWATILFLAVLSQIDTDLYEASSVDGASRWRQLWHITLPGMRGIIILLLILKLGDSLTVGFEQIILQQAAVGVGASEVIDTYVYNNGIVGGNWGVAAAVGLVKGVISVVLVLGANKLAHLFGESGVYQK
ncbi:sugar ABC transporter permease [Arthrobacter sp. GMC3]|uniref:ABC transporter permease n=1 Tax=Arthrobacter sp. GMC3 TaxID=2058894 RepID=UPI001CA4C883|nr:ABC transporter permease subunit [Arthrobacter sp. GMC3]